MSEKNNMNIGEELSLENNTNNPKLDPFSSLNKVFDENVEFNNSMNTLMDALFDDSSSEDDSQIELECVEIDGRDYIIAKRIEVLGNTYTFLINEEDVMDYFFRKIILIDGEEYITKLDSENELNLVLAHLRLEMLERVEQKLSKNENDIPSKQ